MVEEEALQKAIGQVDSGSVLEMIMGGSLVVQLVLLILVMFSFLSWAITISKFFLLRRARQDTDEFDRIYSETRDLSRVDDSARRLLASPVAGVFVAGYKEIIRLLQERSNTGSRLHLEHSLEGIRSSLIRAESNESERL